MLTATVMHRLGTTAVAVAIAWLAPTAALSAAGGDARATAPAGSQLGFVVSDIGYALSKDAGETGACPDGLSAGYKNFGDAFIGKSDLQRRDGEVEDKYLQRVFRSAMSDPNTRNLCHNPEAGQPDPNWHIVTGANVPVEGIDLDGQDSRANGKPAPNTCAHDDFRGFNGEHGIDNQYFRAVGCTRSYQPTGSSIPWSIEMLTGAWGILITLSGVDDIRNDPDVTVGIYANADPIQLSPNRVPLTNATYAIDQDPRFRATTHGRIVNGVLTTDPVNLRFHKITNSIYLERNLDDARLALKIGPDGGLEGYLGGYTPVEDIYNFEFSFRNGKNAQGQAASLQLINGSALGRAGTLGYTCNGAYFALKKLADGHRDPKTGQCTAISTQYRIKAIPAFVVDTQTKSVNSGLDGRGGLY
jgi:hypothetical protein